MTEVASLKLESDNLDEANKVKEKQLVMFEKMVQKINGFMPVDMDLSIEREKIRANEK